MMPPRFEAEYFPRLGEFLNQQITRILHPFPPPTTDQLNSPRFLSEQWGLRSRHWTDPKKHFVASGSRRQRQAIRAALDPFLQGVLNPATKLLDLGSGGLTQVYLPSTVLPRLTALDLSSPALLKSAAARRVLADADQSLPFADSSFDFVSAFFLMRYLKDQKHLLGEIRRVLKPGGRVILLDNWLRLHPLERSYFDPHEIAAMTIFDQPQVARILASGVNGVIFAHEEKAIDFFTGIKAQAQPLST